MKLFKKLAMLALVVCSFLSLAGLCFESNAADVTYSYEFTKEVYSSNSSVQLGTVNWTLSGDGGYWGYANGKGQQLGSGSKPYTSMTLTSDTSFDNIKSISISTSGGSKISGSFTVSVGDINIGETTSLSTTDTKYTFDVESKSGNVKFTYTQTTKKAIYIKSIEVVYVSNDPSLVLTSDNSYTKVNGDDITIVATKNNISTNSNIVWSSSNSNVATISDDGKLTPVSFGKTTVKATLDDYTSNELEIIVYPDNSNRISIADALKICEFTGSNATPYEYTVKGNIKTVESDKVTISDGSNEIIVYSPKNVENLSVNDTIIVTGKLCEFYNVKEFTYDNTWKKVYNVTFMLGDESYECYEEVEANSKIKAPTEPTKEGNTFKGWYNNTTVWDFENDLVNENLTLEARWENNGILDFNNNLKEVKAYMSLAYKYTETSKLDESEDAIIKHNSSTTKNMSGDNDAKTYFNLDDTIFSIISKKNGVSNHIGLNKDGTMRLYANKSDGNGGELVITASKNIKKIEIEFGTIVSNFTVNGLEGTKDQTIYDINSKEVAIKNISVASSNNQVYIKSIKVYLDETKYKDVYSDVDFRIRCGVDSSLTSLSGLPEGATYKYGVEVSTDSKTVKYTSDKLSNENSVLYVVIDLGDVLNNLTRLEEKFTVVAYVEYEGETYYSSESKTYSVLDLLKQYNKLEASKDAVSSLVAVLEKLGYTME